MGAGNPVTTVDLASSCRPEEVQVRDLAAREPRAPAPSVLVAHDSPTWPCCATLGFRFRGRALDEAVCVTVGEVHHLDPGRRRIATRVGLTCGNGLRHASAVMGQLPLARGLGGCLRDCHGTTFTSMIMLR